MNFGIIGTNFISDWFVNAGRHCEGFCVQAVYSRTMEKGRTFADKHGIPDCYDSLEALASADNWMQCILQARQPVMQHRVSRC